jgi:hypothetical protein
MPLSPNDMERLLKAIDHNTAALLTVAAMNGQKGEPNLTRLKIVERVFAGYLEVVDEAVIGDK